MRSPGIFPPEGDRVEQVTTKSVNKPPARLAVVEIIKEHPALGRIILIGT